MAEAVHEHQPERSRDAPASSPSLDAAPHAMLGLQALIGNRAVSQLVQRRVLQREITDVDVKKRYDVSIRHHTQEQVRALYLGAGMVYSGDAVWHEPSNSWIVDRSQLIDLSANAGEKADTLPSDWDLERFENSLDAILKSEPLPEPGTVSEVDNFSTAHINATKAVINYYLIAAYRGSLDEDGKPTKSVLRVTQIAAGMLTAARQQSALRSQSLILRDAQRYFYGRLAAWSNVAMMKSKASQGTDPTLTKDPALMSEEERKRGEESPFLADPDTSNIEKMKALQGDYESLKQIAKFFGSDVNVTKFPSSAPGGRWWLDKGGNDSYNDMKLARYKENGLPYLVR